MQKWSAQAHSYDSFRELLLAKRRQQAAAAAQARLYCSALDPGATSGSGRGRARDSLDSGHRASSAMPSQQPSPSLLDPASVPATVRYTMEGVHSALRLEPPTAGITQSGFGAVTVLRFSRLSTEIVAVGGASGAVAVCYAATSPDTSYGGGPVAASPGLAPAGVWAAPASWRQAHPPRAMHTRAVQALDWGLGNSQVSRLSLPAWFRHH
jgi:hypothetical protein